VQDLEAQNLYPTVPQYYDFLQNRVLVQFKPRYEDNPGRSADFDIMLSKKMTYEVVSSPYLSWVL
jgi:ubiquitin carboxyl-terminal hydrolase 7